MHCRALFLRMVERIWATNFQFPGGACCRQGRAGRRDAAAGRDAGRLGRRLGQTGANPRAGRIYSADRLRAAGHRRGEGFDQNMASPWWRSKGASWAAVLRWWPRAGRGILYGLLYGLELGIASKPQAMANLMTLNRNGQAITLQRAAGERVTDLGGLKRLIDRSAPGSYTFAHTFLPAPMPCGFTTGWRAPASSLQRCAPSTVLNVSVVVILWQCQPPGYRSKPSRWERNR